MILVNHGESWDFYFFWGGDGIYIIIHSFCLQVFDLESNRSLNDLAVLDQDLFWGTHAMDQTSLIFCGLSFLAGFSIRGSLIDNRPEPHTCQCQCQWSGTPAVESASPGQGLSVWIIGGGICVVIILLLSNAALVCKISWKDTQSGTDREVSFGVKGKSKGVYGAPRGLALSG